MIKNEILQTFSVPTIIKRKPMLNLNKISQVIATVSLGALLSAQFAYAANTYDNKKTTTVEQTTTQTTSTAPRPAVRRAAPVVPVTTTTSDTVTLTTKPGELRKVLDEDALKKMDDTICSKGFKAYVGNDKKNVCQGKAVAPDLAYSCIWSENGNAAFAPTPQGPCDLEYSEHQKSVVITKSEYTGTPPLAYGTEAHCCFRAAQGPVVSTVETSPTKTVVTHK